MDINVYISSCLMDRSDKEIAIKTKKRVSCLRPFQGQKVVKVSVDQKLMLQQVPR